MPDNLSGLRCPHCEYDLTGLREHRCPECGSIFNPKLLRSGRLPAQSESFGAVVLGTAVFFLWVHLVALFLHLPGIDIPLLVPFEHAFLVMSILMGTFGGIINSALAASGVVHGFLYDKNRDMVMCAWALLLLAVGFVLSMTLVRLVN